jgi:NDP-sugar pyrophosphorylase family protein
MKAMILAAGYGTRLRPLTDHKPKALVQINGLPMLEIVIRKLIDTGIRDIIINVHHLNEMIVDFLKANKNFGVHIEISREQEILGTGGALKQAAYFFENSEPFLVHNVDIISDIDLMDMVDFHHQQNNIATLAVMKRKTSRYFLVSEENIICGHVNKKNETVRIAKKSQHPFEELAFSGIYVISPQLLPELTEHGFFSIIDVYLRLIAAGHRIGVYRIDNCYWRDLGKPEHIKAVEIDIQQGLIKI